MWKEFKFKGLSLQNGDYTEYLYGYKDKLIKLLEMGEDEILSAKDLYSYFVKEVIHREGNLIPSRMEKKYESVDWARAHRNYKESKYLRPKQKEFLFRFCHDLLLLGARNHFRGADKECKREKTQGSKCNSLETRVHFFKNCICASDVYCIIIAILETVLKKKLDEKTVFTMSFRCKDNSINVVAVWFLVYVFELMYSSGVVDPIVVLDAVLREINWILQKCNSKYDDAFEVLRIETQIQIIGIKYDN